MGSITCSAGVEKGERGKMAVNDKLNEEWASGQQSRAVFEFRAVVQGFADVLVETLAKMDEISSRNDFSGVDPELKAEGIEIRNEITDLKNALADNADFINWKPS